MGDLAERSARDEDAARWLGDPRNLVPQGTRLVQRLLDALVIAAALWWLDGRAPWLSVPFLVLLGHHVARAASHAVDVLLATPEEPRPALGVVTHEDRERTRASTRLVVVWFFAEWVLGHVALGILDGDRLAEVVDTLGCVAALAVGWVLLARWAPSVHRRLEADPDPDATVRWLTGHAGSPGSLRHVGLAGLGVGVLAARGVLEALRRRSDEGRLGWFGAALERRRLAATAEEPGAGPDAEAVARVRSAPTPPPRGSEIAVLQQAFGAWHHQRVRGLVAVTGDPGAGLTAVLAGLADAVDLPVERLEAPRARDPAEVRRWLQGALGVEPADDADEAIRRIAALPPRVVIIDDLHRLYLRTVGGYDALRAVLAVLQETSSRHFWVVACTSEAWTVFEGLPQRLPLGGFGRVVHLTPLGPSALRDWLLRRATAAGLGLRWERLAGGIGSATALATERAENAWFRLLADASGGNARLALELFAASLRRAPDGRIDLVLPAAPDPRPLERAPDLTHFLLAALLQHRELDLGSLSTALNLGPDIVRSTALGLVADGVLEVGAGGYGVQPAWMPAVKRILRQRHFLVED